MVRRPVAGVDDGHLADEGPRQRRAFLGVAHGDDVAVAGDGVDRVGHGFSLGGGGGVRAGKAQNAAPQGKHGAFEGKTGPGGGLEEQGGQDPAPLALTVILRPAAHVLRQAQQLIQLPDQIVFR